VSRAIRFTCSAGRQIDAALDWWARNRTMAPTLLADELDHAISLITSFPDSGIPARAARLQAVRRMILPRSHYALYYRLLNVVVEVVALWHQHRDSEPDETV
jgi:plasmid stabilization system protein ParE